MSSRKPLFINNSQESTSNSVGSFITKGGIAIGCSRDSVNSSNGGGLTIAGGAAIGKKLFVGSDINFSGNLYKNGQLFVSGNNAISSQWNGAVGETISYTSGGVVMSNSTIGNLRITGNLNTTTISTGSLNITNTAGNIVLSSSGRVGINTTNTRYNLEISGSTVVTGDNNVLACDGAAVRLGFLKKAGIGPVIAANSTGSIIFSHSNQASIESNISTATLTERMRIAGNGRIGIGTNAPASFVDIVYPAGLGTASGIRFGDTSATARLFAGSTFMGLADNLNNTRLVMLQSNGNIGIGITNPDKPLTVASASTVVCEIASSNANVSLQLSNSTTQSFIQVGGSNLQFIHNGAERMRVSSEGNIVGFRSAGDTAAKTFMTAVGKSCALFPQTYPGSIYFYWRNGNSYYIHNPAGGSYFTGQHGNVPIDSDMKTNLQKYIGLIVSSADEGYYAVNPITKQEYYGKDAITISEALPKIKLTTIDKDKAVWGVVTNIKNDNRGSDGNWIEDDNTEWSDRIDDGSFVRVNGVGEGALWVSNIYGNIENGDYICSSSIPGYGRKQDDDVLHNFTVAKATCSVNFSDPLLETKFNIRYLLSNGQQVSKIEYNDIETDKYISVFVGCTYHCS
jgi:hypothetical protein